MSVKSIRKSPASPRPLALRLPLGDAELAIQALHVVADRVEGTASRLKGLAPELHARAGRLRRIAATIDAQAEGCR